ncbi:MAG: hypothetical protein NC110_05460 [Ruminococcus sp.]|nr:hypothetical protein [Ruminococcus sp.]
MWYRIDEGLRMVIGALILFGVFVFACWLSDVIEDCIKRNKAMRAENKKLKAENRQLKLQVEVAEQIIPVIKGRYNALKFENSVFSRTDKPTVRERACAVHEGK